MEDKLAFLHTTCAGVRGTTIQTRETDHIPEHSWQQVFTHKTHNCAKLQLHFLSIKIQTLGAFLGTFACGILFLPSLVALLNCDTVTYPCLSLPTRMSLMSVTQEGLGAGWSWDLKLCFPLLFKMQILFKMPQFGSFLHL